MTLPHTSPLNASEYLLNDFNYFWQHSRSQTSGTCTFSSVTCTLQEINISHVGKRNIIFKMDFSGDMLVPRRVNFNIYSLHSPKKKKKKTSSHPKLRSNIQRHGAVSDGVTGARVEPRWPLGGKVQKYFRPQEIPRNSTPIS